MNSILLVDDEAIIGAGAHEPLKVLDSRSRWPLLLSRASHLLRRRDMTQSSSSLTFDRCGERTPGPETAFRRFANYALWK